MAKAAKILCDRCESRMFAGQPFCRACGHPTTFASHEERTAWEVAQYRAKTMSAPISSIAEDAPRKRAASRVDVLDRPKAPREKKGLSSLFGRRRPHTTITLPQPKRVEPPAADPTPAPVLTVVRPEAIPAPVTPKPVAAAQVAAPKPLVAPQSVAAKPVAPAPRPAPRVRAPKVERPMAKAAAPAPKADGLVSKVERAMNDNEGLIDTPATVLAMRLLNQRVRELDEKVQRLERELDAAKATPPAAEPEKPRKRFGR